jgi:hypothetical protein
MNADGSDQQRFTYFDTPGRPEYMEGGITAADRRRLPLWLDIALSIRSGKRPDRAQKGTL